MQRVKSLWLALCCTIVLAQVAIEANGFAKTSAQRLRPESQFWPPIQWRGQDQDEGVALRFTVWNFTIIALFLTPAISADAQHQDHDDSSIKQQSGLQ